MEPHPAVRSDGTYAPDRILILEMTDAEADTFVDLLTTHQVAAADLRHQHQDDQTLVDRLDAELALADRLNLDLDAGVRAPVLFGLPEGDVLRLPATREVLCGPGVGTATAVHDALAAAGRSERAAWEGAAREVARELAAGVVHGVRGSTVRPLARLHRAILREAATYQD